MAMQYHELVMTESVRRAQRQYYGQAAKITGGQEYDPLGMAEVEFIAARDSFYLGTVSETGWPYIQHRGGPVGFLQVLNSTTLGFADYKGNRQLLSTGNISANNRVALFLMDYKNRERLKILGHARIEDAKSQTGLVTRLTTPSLRANVDRVVVIDVVSFDWNCPKYITSRYSIEEVEEVIGPLKRRIAELETHLQALGS